MTQQQAHGTSLLAVTACGFGGAASFFSSGGQLDPTAALIIAGSGMLTAGLGARATAKLKGSTLKKMLG